MMVFNWPPECKHTGQNKLNLPPENLIFQTEERLNSLILQCAYCSSREKTMMHFKLWNESFTFFADIIISNKKTDISTWHNVCEYNLYVLQMYTCDKIIYILIKFYKFNRWGGMQETTQKLRIEWKFCLTSFLKFTGNV